MALVIADRVRETTTSTGTGDLLLAGPYAGFQAFSVVGNGNTTYYAIIDNVTGQWEVGTGTYTTATNTLSRDAALASSNGGAKVVFGVGIKDVILTQPAERTVYLNAAGNGITVSATAFTNDGVVYANSTSTLTTGANLTFNGTLLNVTGDINLTGTLYQDGIPLSIGDVFGPSSATSGAVALFDGTTGKLLKNGGVSDALINGLTVGKGAGAVVTNTAVGVTALSAATTGSRATAVGYYALSAQTTGISNTAVGSEALQSLTSGNFNVALGVGALEATATGVANTALGHGAIGSNISGGYNTAVGDQALVGNTTGSTNTAVGSSSGWEITTGSKNSILGSFSGNQGGLDITTANNYIVLSDGDGNPRVVVNGSGNVGLGNVAPAYRLDVGGSINFTGGLYQNGTPFTSGDVFGPASATAGAVALYDGTTGKLLKDGGATDALINGLTVGRGAGGVATNTAVGSDALYSNTTGEYNTALGRGALYSNTSGTYNTAVGMAALSVNTSGNANVAVGDEALVHNTTGSENVAVGFLALLANTVGLQNIAIGSSALVENTAGQANTAVGTYALTTNTTGDANTALGYSALYSNTTGFNNTASGYSALNTVGTGHDNTAYGYFSLVNTTGNLNTAFGSGSGQSITTGSKNSILGAFSGNQGGLNITTANNYIVLSDGDGNPRVVSNGSGLVGINQVTPAYNLDVGGDINFTGTLYQNGSPFGGGGGSGDVVGPASATAGAVALFDGTTGKLLKDGGVSDALVNGLTVGKGAGGVSSNTALGVSALAANTTGADNTAVGQEALLLNTFGEGNTAVGKFALYNNTGFNNTAVGREALFSNTTGTLNVAVGLGAGYDLTTGSYNAIFGGFSGNQGGLNITTANNFLVLADGEGNPRIVADSTGNVGIGQVAPAYKLDVSGSINFTGILYQNGVPFGGGSGGGDVYGPTGATAGAVALFDGTSGKVLKDGGVMDALINGLTVGRGAGGLLANSVIGYNVLAANTTGNYNVAIGPSALSANTIGSFNIGIGFEALSLNTTGNSNTAIGGAALSLNTTGNGNTAVGDSALYGNTTGNDNTAVGSAALIYNTTGYENVAVGSQALLSNTTGASNTANGAYSLVANTTGNANTASGAYSLYSNTTGYGNAAVGMNALYANTTGYANTAFGGSALTSNTLKRNNTAVGFNVLGYNTTGVFNTAIGSNSGLFITTGSKNSILGSFNGNQNGLDIRTASNYIVLSDGDGNPRIITNGSGNVGIGQVAPAYKLDVSGSINFTGTLYQNGTPFGGGGGSGDVVGPASATAGAVALFDGTTGKLLKNGGVSDALINGLRVGIGAGAVSSNTVLSNTGLQANTTGAGNVALGNAALASNVTGGYNVAAGYYALNANAGGTGNIAIGSQALQFSTNDSDNVAIGLGALQFTNGGLNNIAVGTSTLSANTTGSDNTAVGTYALLSNTTGYQNTASGSNALFSNVDGYNNTASGAYSLYANTSGIKNTAFGNGALGANITSSYNTAVGESALASTTGEGNTGVGYAALLVGTSGTDNTAVGRFALSLNGAGVGNTAVGSGALQNANGGSNTAVGYLSGQAITSGSKHSILGSYNGNQGGLDIRTANNYIVLSDGDGNPRIVTDGSGNVGVGVVAPSVKLDVGGAIKAAGLIESTTGGFKFPDGTTQTTAAAGGGVTSFNTRTGAVTLTSLDVTTALGYTPYDSTNPSGYITSSALTPYLTSATAASTYQTILVSGTSIKTINSTSLLGSGDITTGDVVGPASATSNSLAQFDGTTGKLLKSPSGLTYNGTTLSVTGGTTVASGTITTSAPALDATQTWNAAGVTFTGMRFNVTDTASAAASMLMDLQVGGTSKFNISKSGNLVAADKIATLNLGTASSPGFQVGITATGLFVQQNAYVGLTYSGTEVLVGNANGIYIRPSTGTVTVSSAGKFAFAGGIAGQVAEDINLFRDAAATLAQRNGTNAQTFRLYNTYTDASNYERLGLNWASSVATVAVENLGTGTARPLAVNVGGSERLRMFTSGGVSIGNTTDPGAANLSVTGTISSAGGVKLRTSATASVTSPLTWSSGTSDQLAYTALANALTINADSGTPTDGQRMTFRFKDNGTPRVLTFTGGASKSFRNVGTVLTLSGSNWTYTTTASKTVYIGCIYNLGDDRWDLVSVAQEA